MRVFPSLIFLTFMAALFSSCHTAAHLPGPNGDLSYKITFPKHFDPQKDSCTMVILMHGIFSSKDFAPMPHIARTLAKNGYGSIRFDFNGHGHSGGKMEDMTIERELADANAIWQFLQSHTYTKKIILLGHSQGGVIASMLAGQLSKSGHSPDGLILLAPGTVIKEATQGGHFFGKTFDPSNPPEYIKCFNMFKLGRNYLIQTQQLDIYGTSASYQGPACIIHGDRDGIVPLWCSEKYRTVLAAPEFHLIHGENHMIINKQQKVIQHIVDFLNKIQ